MKTLIAVIVWCLLFAVSWPLALLALAAWPIVWLLSLPFRLVGIACSAVFALLRAVTPDAPAGGWWVGAFRVNVRAGTPPGSTRPCPSCIPPR
jgi:hypothetical protein